MGEFAYDGVAGRTRTERVRVFASRGSAHEVQVYRVVNVAEHPHLRDPALRGTLHVLDDGEPVQVPFVYHDPEQRQFILVVPHQVRNRELSERSNVLAALMREETSTIPDYVRHFAVVYGSDGLSAYLERRANPRTSELEAWSEALAREDAQLRHRVEEIEQRERALDDVRRAIPLAQDEEELEVIDLVELNGEQEVPITSVVTHVKSGRHELVPLDLVEDAEDEDVEDDWDTERRDSDQVISLDDEVPLSDDRWELQMLPPRNVSGSIFLQPNLQPNQQPNQESIQRSLAAQLGMQTAASGLFQRVPAMIPPATFWRRADREFAVVMADGVVWLFVQQDDDDTSLVEGSTELLIQYKAADHIGVVVLTLRDERSEVVRRTFLDPSDLSDRELLAALGNHFEATVVVYNDERQLLRSFRVRAPREGNVRALLQRIERLPVPSTPAWERALESVRAAPPNLRDEQDPFRRRGAATSPAEAWHLLRSLEMWSTPDRIDEAILGRSIPADDVETAQRRILMDALRFGVAPVSLLVREAVKFGLATDESEFVEMIHRHFDGGRAWRLADDANIDDTRSSDDSSDQPAMELDAQEGDQDSKNELVADSEPRAGDEDSNDELTAAPESQARGTRSEQLNTEASEADADQARGARSEQLNTEASETDADDVEVDGTEVDGSETKSVENRQTTNVLDEAAIAQNLEAIEKLASLYGVSLPA